MRYDSSSINSSSFGIEVKRCKKKTDPFKKSHNQWANATSEEEVLHSQELVWYFFRSGLWAKCFSCAHNPTGDDPIRGEVPWHREGGNVWPGIQLEGARRCSYSAGNQANIHWRLLREHDVQRHGHQHAWMADHVHFGPYQLHGSQYL